MADKQSCDKPATSNDVINVDIDLSDLLTHAHISGYTGAVKKVQHKSFQVTAKVHFGKAEDIDVLLQQWADARRSRQQ